jgi:tetratricopeptide (TPR) repeat protein
MPPEAVQWEPAIIVLTGGLVLGLLVAGWLRRRSGASAPPEIEAAPLELRDLDGRVAALLVQLRELEDAAVKRTPEQLARERHALELEAARALQARDALAAKLGAPQKKPAPAAQATGGSARGFVWGVATTAAAAVLLFFVSQSASRRPEGGSPTGTGMGSSPRNAAAPVAPSALDAAGVGGANDAQTLELRQTLARNPDDLETRLVLARHLLGERDLMGVWNETQYVLERQPGNAHALTYQSLVRLAMGQGDMAVSMLKQAIAAEPDLIEAHENLAFVYTSLGRGDEAAAAVAEVARRSPGDAEKLKQALEQLAQSRESQAASPESVSAHKGVPPPSETAEGSATPFATAGGASAPAAAAESAMAAPVEPGKPAAVFGWIEADASVAARVPAGTAIFLTVRPAGVAQGPPVAVKRLASSKFPLQFEVGIADSMMGQPLPDKMRIDVRADSDGDPLTHNPTDPAGYADGVPIGKTGVRIPLK